MDFFTSLIGTLVYTLWMGIKILFWWWPFYYLTWPLAIIMIVSIRTEYRRSGGGPSGAAHALWYGLKTLPGKSNKLATLVTTLGLQSYSLVSKSETPPSIPTPVRKWLGHEIGETQVVEKIVEVEKLVYVDRPAPPTWRESARIWKRAGIAGALFG